ncbi:glycogenin glucosyltransferase [Coniosporium tulheliwenetii]|uniref:Glycogenin glucosyltransferase n=1 Tax=Coniosporium tulheliwenetii TaxID=3383036 RepID=A0ACC2YQC8_9PEZI|nr:glycogenin glucosyltransferase [Cladosporium sp. JES 115]
MATYGEDLLMSDSYLPGAAVLAHSLRDAGTKKKLVVLKLYDELIPVDRIANPNPANLYLMGRPDLTFAFTKIALWRQDRFRKIVYLDSDVVVLRAPDELFDIEAPFAAAPDIGWPDAFNTGVMVLSPNMGDYWALQTMASSGDSFDGADQGLLNQYYEHKNWHRISFTYNCTPNAQYQWEPAYRHYKSNISAVHFIGKEKPWSKGRPSGSGPGVYNELLGRWWAVYDRRLKPKAISSSAYGQPSRPSIVAQYVLGENAHPDYKYTPEQQVANAPRAQEPEPERPVMTSERPTSSPGEPAENIDQGIVAPVPTSEQRRFSAPRMEWDATRSAPPAESKPEAADFNPGGQYEFNESKELFHAPAAYPEPPKDMWYEVPESKPKVEERPPPIFPWEKERDVPPPSRVFAEDLPSPTPELAPQPAAESVESGQIGGAASPPSPTPLDEASSFQGFAPSTNVWDTMPDINRYVQNVVDIQQRKNRPRMIGIPAPGVRGEIVSPDAPGVTPQQRRASLILTDFPTEVERPSLPVTPAPRRRSTFWGEERNAEGQLPAAEGYQIKPNGTFKLTVVLPLKDPTERLEQLRRSSLLEFEHLKQAADTQKMPPLRELPEHSIPRGRDHEAEHHSISAGHPQGFDGASGAGKGGPTAATAPAPAAGATTESAEGDVPVPDKGLAAAAATETGSAVAEKTGEGKAQVEKPTFAAVDFKTAAETGR